MITTIHKCFKERLSVEMQKETSLRDVFDDGYDDKLTLVNTLVEVDQETFSDSLKDKKPCFVTRFTFVVEHDTDKNRVIFKKYFTLNVNLEEYL